MEPAQQKQISGSLEKTSWKDIAYSIREYLDSKDNLKHFVNPAISFKKKSLTKSGKSYTCGITLKEGGKSASFEGLLCNNKFTDKFELLYIFKSNFRPKKIKLVIQEETEDRNIECSAMTSSSTPILPIMPADKMVQIK